MCVHCSSIWLIRPRRCFEYSRPSFAGDCLSGRNIVVAGTGASSRPLISLTSAGWACGSSRESAATMLAACGCPAVIAKSFAFIGRRNLIANAIVACVHATIVLD